MPTHRRANANYEIVAQAGDLLGESPAWLSRTDELVRVDILGQEVIWLDATGGARSRHFGAPTTFVVPAAEGVVAGVGMDIIHAHDDGTSTTLDTVASRSCDRLNDGKCDPRGVLWFGSISRDRSASGALYRLRPGGRAELVVDGVAVSNGIGWSPRGDRMYFIDSLTQRVDVFDYDLDSATISNRREFASVPVADGMPDGLCVDSEGAVWVALFGGWAIRRYSPGGLAVHTIRMPFSHPTSLAFGGADLGALYVTSAAKWATPDGGAPPLAGAVLRMYVGVGGVPIAEFAHSA